MAPAKPQQSLFVIKPKKRVLYIGQCKSHAISAVNHVRVGDPGPYLEWHPAKDLLSCQTEHHQTVSLLYRPPWQASVNGTRICWVWSATFWQHVVPNNFIKRQCVNDVLTACWSGSRWPGKPTDAAPTAFCKTHHINQKLLACPAAILKLNSSSTITNHFFSRLQLQRGLQLTLCKLVLQNDKSTFES